MKKLFAMFVLAFSMAACSGSPVQIESISYVLPNGEVASCLPHPTKPEYMQCSYSDGVNQIAIAVERKRLKRVE